jgi:hypothetical protein
MLCCGILSSCVAACCPIDRCRYAAVIIAAGKATLSDAAEVADHLARAPTMHGNVVVDDRDSGIGTIRRATGILQHATCNVHHYGLRRAPYEHVACNGQYTMCKMQRATCQLATCDQHHCTLRPAACGIRRTARSIHNMRLAYVRLAACNAQQCDYSAGLATLPRCTHGTARRASLLALGSRAPAVTSTAVRWRHGGVWHTQFAVHCGALDSTRAFRSKQRRF